MPAAPEAPLTAEQIFAARLPLARSYAELLATKGIEQGLLGPREVSRIWDRHLVNCAVLTELLPKQARIVDVGSGAGLPGLALAIRRPDLRVDLVESLRRRVTFLTEAIEELGLGDQVRVLHGRAEDVNVLEAAGQASWVTARAVAPLDRLAAWCLPFLAPSGRLLAIKGASVLDELTRGAVAIVRAGGRNAQLLTCGEQFGVAVPVVSIERVVPSSRKRGAK